MNTVLNSYGQLCGCPEILKKSCKFFCRGLDIRVTEIMNPYAVQSRFFASSLHFFYQKMLRYLKQSV